jgi:hypothetical protein
MPFDQETSLSMPTEIAHNNCVQSLHPSWNQQADVVEAFVLQNKTQGSLGTNLRLR